MSTARLLGLTLVLGRPDGVGLALFLAVGVVGACFLLGEDVVWRCAVFNDFGSANKARSSGPNFFAGMGAAKETPLLAATGRALGSQPDSATPQSVRNFPRA